jgi:drug/metabolite transporter (DMT)-like permease
VSPLPLNPPLPCSPAWGAFVYRAMFSMWLGFFAWYRGLQLGGMLRVCQVQLQQPDLSRRLAVVAAPTLR